MSRYSSQEDWIYDQETEDIVKSMTEQTEKAEDIDEDIDSEDDAETVDTEKAIDTSVTEVIGKESVEKNKVKKNVSKSFIYEKIYSYFYNVDFYKAKEIHRLISKISEMEGQKEITEETIQKAFDVLKEAAKDVTSDSSSEIEKASQKYSPEKLEKALSAYPNQAPEDIQKSLVSDGYSEDFAKEVISYSKSNKTGVSFQKAIGSLEEIMKSQREDLTSRLEAVTELYENEKSSSEQLEKSFNSMAQEFENLKQRLDKVENQPASLRKSVQTEKFIEKYKDQLPAGKDTEAYSISNPEQRKQLINKAWSLSKIDEVGEANADKSFLKAAEQLEIAKALSPDLQAKFAEKGILVLN